MYNYLTSVYQEGDKQSVLISAIQALHFARHGIDIISKTPVLTHFSRPNWPRVFHGLSRRKCRREDRGFLLWTGRFGKTAGEALPQNEQQNIH